MEICNIEGKEVRDVIEQILKSQGKWMNGDAFGW